MGVTERAKHTPEPWELDTPGDEFRIRMGTAVPYTGRYQSQHMINWEPGVYYDDDYPADEPQNRQYLEAEANARRIVACVNACEGVPTEALESGVVRELVSMLEMHVQGLRNLIELGVFPHDEWDANAQRIIDDTMEVLDRVRGGDEA